MLRLTSDVNVLSTRATVAECYDQLLQDLEEAEVLLPSTPLYQTRPGRGAAHMVKSRLYLHMGDYDRALQEAEAALADHQTLLDFNSLDTTSSSPFPGYPNHGEILFYNTVDLKTTNLYFYARVDTVLYQSYDVHDLRKAIFYNDLGTSIQFKGRYTSTPYNFGGLATNELYLIQAECLARLGETDRAMDALNTLLQKRWKSGEFEPFVATTTEEALALILAERRKELPFTGSLRWEDLRRLNLEPQFAITLRRELNGVTHTLPPNDPRYVLDIPPREVEESHIIQNNR